MSGKDEKKAEPLFHYTDKNGVDGIQQTGHIKPSQDDIADAILGKGVYLTPTPPSEGKAKVAEKIYDSGELAQERLKEGRLDYAFEFKEIPKDKLEKDNNRDIIKHDGKLKLKDYDYTLHEVNKACIPIQKHK